MNCMVLILSNTLQANFDKNRIMNRNPLLKFFVKEYRKKIAKQLFIEANGVVKRGLFEGMHLGKEIHWGKADVASKIFGFYESEIVELIKDKHYESLVNLGAADGYYPIGMLMQKMIRHAYCFEENPLGAKYINANAKLNRLDVSISIYGRADSQFYKQLPEGIFGRNNLVLCDIEGGEFDLFTDEVIGAFSQSSFIIEIHDFKFDDGKKRRQKLIDAFKNFDIEMVKSKPKQWSDIDQITELGDNDRALVCSEGRRVLGEWLVAIPRKTDYGT